MYIKETQDKIYTACVEQCPHVLEKLIKVRKLIPGYKREIWQYQAAVLYCLASQFNTESAKILEIGTAWGYSAAVIAEAAPLAMLYTLNPQADEAAAAARNLLPYPKVSVLVKKSWDFLKEWQGALTSNDFALPSPHSKYMFDMIWVDGDHKRVAHDFPFWNHLREGGLFLFHDFSPEWSSRACVPVYDGLMKFREWLGRDFDVLICDETDTGMAGFYRRASDPVYKGEVPPYAVA